jgi:predicted TPR repeat methyltransferase
MAIAIRYLQAGELKEAGALLARILELAPSHADALHYSGMLAFREARPKEAAALMRRSLEHAPDQADWHSNLGIVLQSLDDLDGAIAAFQRAIELDPAHVNAHNNLGVLLRVFGRHAEAEEQYRTAIALDPEHGDAYNNLAILCDVMGRPHEALAAYAKALTLKTGHPEARRLLALAYHQVGQPEKAIELLETWVRDEPDNPRAIHSLAAHTGRDVPPRAADAYVRMVFDSFSETFEAKLARLDYRAPELVAASLAAAGIAAGGGLDILDAGCGTGLCAPLLAPAARRLVGVDLSNGMLEHARNKGLYQEVVQGELTAYLREHPQAFDVVVSADTLVYFGALEDAVAAAAAALRPGGIVVFTVEEAQDPASTAPYALQPHGRYAHRADYVERLLVGQGLYPVIDRAPLRKESGLPVAGLVVRAAKPAVATGAAQGGADGARRIGEDHV